MKFALLLVIASLLFAQQPQNPSPMVEHTRAHLRLEKQSPPGQRWPLELGTLFVPQTLKAKARTPLLVFFHGGAWLPEAAAARRGRTAVISIQIGPGSGRYSGAFVDPSRFPKLLEEAESKAGVHFDPITLGAWSAGCGAVREILKSPDSYARVQRVLLIDGIHTGYVGDKPGPLESPLETESLEVYLQFARDAIAGKKRLIITHSEIFPGTYASTTETADYLLAQLRLRRRALVKWGPMGTQQLSEARKGKFLLVGYAGNSAPDHVDQLHSLPEYLGWFK